MVRDRSLNLKMDVGLKRRKPRLGLIQAGYGIAGGDANSS